MKKYSLLYCVFVACAMVLSSCNNEFENANNEKTMKMSFTATSGNEVTTRTTLDEGNGISVNWTASDAISVFDASGVNNPFTLADGAGTNIGHFDGTVTNGTMRWTALYPYSANTTISGNVISNVAMPAEQEATVNGFDPKSNLMTAYTTNDKLNFKQVVCYAQITTTIDCKKITFKANGEESLAGTAELTVATDGRATNRVTSNGASEVTLIPANGQTTIPAGTYHIGILPQTLTQGFTVEAFKAEAEAKLVKTYNKQTLAFGRDKIVNLGTTEGWSDMELDDDVPVLQSNSTITDVLKVAYKLLETAKSFKEYSSNPGLLITQYGRINRYNSSTWDIAGGKIPAYVKAELDGNEVFKAFSEVQEISLPNDDTWDAPHFWAALNGMMKNTGDLCGWGGDLVEFAADVKSNNSISFPSNSFNEKDWKADADAYNIYKIYKSGTSGTILDAIETYATSSLTENYRITKFLEGGSDILTRFNNSPNGFLLNVLMSQKGVNATDIAKAAEKMQLYIDNNK